MRQARVNLNMSGKRGYGVLAVSMNNNMFESTKLMALVAAGKKMFTKFDVVVCDSLQRHNLIAGGEDANEAHRKAVEMGKTWQVKHEKSIHEIYPDTKFIHWDSLVKHSSYEPGFRLFEEAFHHNQNLKEAMNFSVNEYYKRHNDTQRDCSTVYFAEECVVWYYVLPRLYQDITAIVYPGEEPKVLSEARKNFKEANKNTSAPVWAQAKCAHSKCKITYAVDARDS